jgi:hypothetical protein
MASDFTSRLSVCVFFIVAFSTSLCAQWLEGGRKQAQALNGNGALLVHQNVMYLWNEQNHFQTSYDNGLTWTDPSDNIQGPNPHVTKMSAANGRVYAGLNFGSGNGVPIYSEDKGVTWDVDTIGAPGHALGWSGLPVVSDIYAWGKWLYVKWDRPVAYSIKTIGGPYVFDKTINDGANNPYSVIAKGDTLFLAGSKVYFTTDGGKTFVFPKNNGYTGYGGKLQVDGKRLYMFAYKAFLQPCYLYYSDDNAENWTTIDITSLTTKRVLNGDLYFPQAFFIKGNHIEFTAGQDKFTTPPNIWKSDDLGKSWSTDSEGIPATFVSGVVNFAYTPNGYLWCVPSYENIYKKKLDSGSTLTRITPDNSGKLSIYPNPSHESFMIQYSGSGNLVDCTISFFNSAGVEQKLKIKKFQETFQVAWGNQASGIYYYKLTNSSNGQYFSGIIIKQ